MKELNHIDFRSALEQVYGSDALPKSVKYFIVFVVSYDCLDAHTGIK